MSCFRFGLFPLLRRGSIPGYDQLEIQLDHSRGNPCWGMQRLSIEISLAIPIFGWFPSDRQIDRHINWVRAAYGLEPFEEDLPF